MAHPRAVDERYSDEMDVAPGSEVKTEQEGSAVNVIPEGQADPLLAQHGRTEYIDTNMQTDNTDQHGPYPNAQTDNTYQQGPYANMQTDNTYQQGPYANMQNDNTNQRGDELTIPISYDHKDQHLPVSTNDKTTIAQGDVELTHGEPTRSEGNMSHQTDGYSHEIGTQVTEEEFIRNQVNVEKHADGYVHEAVGQTGYVHEAVDQTGYVHEAVDQTAGVTQVTEEEFNRSQVNVENQRDGYVHEAGNQRDGYVHEAVNQTARSGEAGVVFEGRTYDKRVFDEFLNEYVYVRDENQEMLAKVVMWSTFYVKYEKVNYQIDQCIILNHMRTLEN